ncbi:hypothetical protein [Xanthomonas phage vB_XooS_NR08]|nr:hypothetical protein [Xanthomonas phage vB_XooS_NR08]
MARQHICQGNDIAKPCMGQQPAHQFLRTKIGARRHNLEDCFSWREFFLSLAHGTTSVGW